LAGVSHFSPISALVGGSLIGLAASVLLLVNGRVAGISGLVGGLLDDNASERGWRLAFLAGFAVAGVAAFLIHPASFSGALPRSAGALAIAGVLVGFGSRLGGGCTSGHGVCGISRGSVRSLAATMTFMLTAGLTVFAVSHFFGGAL
jgi:uncharacterized protein